MVLKPTGQPLPIAEREALQRFVAERGERAACAELQLTVAPLARAIAGFPISRGTAALIRERLAGESAAPRPRKRAGRR